MTTHEFDTLEDIQSRADEKADRNRHNGYLTPVDTQLNTLKAKIEAESDVRRVMELERSGSLWRYMIETVYDMPRFVIGTTDEGFADVRPIFKCGAEWSVRKAWDERNGNEPI